MPFRCRVSDQIESVEQSGCGRKPSLRWLQLGVHGDSEVELLVQKLYRLGSLW
jgi:hypothetical protein